MATEGQRRERRTPPGPGEPRRGDRWGSWLLVGVLLVALLFATRRFSLHGAGEELSYAEFKRRVAAGEVTDVRIGAQELTGTLSDGEGEGAAPPDGQEVGAPEPAAEPRTFFVRRVEDPALVEDLEAHGVEYGGLEEQDFGGALLLWLLPLGILIFLMTSMRSAASRAGAQAMGFGKSRAKLAPETGVGVTFEDVAGCDEAKGELSEMVQFLKDPARFTRLGARIPKGVLLLGPPGTGKTLIARAVAGEAGVPFFSLSGSDFVEMFVGVGAARVRDLFEQAKQRAPCIVFIDEIDAVGRQRGVSMGVVNDEREQTLNQLLTEMDGFEVNSGVILMAATNRPEVLDRALLRPGRFDRQVLLDAPDVDGREAILRVHGRGKPLAPDVDMAALARVTPGMSGADLANALNEAALLAAKRRADAITQRDVEDAIEKVVAGPERRSRRLAEGEKRRVAYHEAGHALAAALSEGADPVQKISIVPRGRAALGYTMQLPEEQQFLRTERELRDRIKVLLAGRAAEELVFGDVSTGAQDDLRQATALARQMVCVYGMSERVGLATCARPDDAFLGQESSWRADCSDETAREVDQEVRALLDQLMDAARADLSGARDRLEAVVRELLVKETLDRRSFEALVAGGAAATPATAAR